MFVTSGFASAESELSAEACTYVHIRWQSYKLSLI